MSNIREYINNKFDSNNFITNFVDELYLMYAESKALMENLLEQPKLDRISYEHEEQRMMNALSGLFEIYTNNPKNDLMNEFNQHWSK